MPTPQASTSDSLALRIFEERHCITLLDLSRSWVRDGWNETGKCVFRHVSQNYRIEIGYKGYWVVLRIEGGLYQKFADGDGRRSLQGALERLKKGPCVECGQPFAWRFYPGSNIRPHQPTGNVCGPCETKLIYELAVE